VMMHQQSLSLQMPNRRGSTGGDGDLNTIASVSIVTDNLMCTHTDGGWIFTTKNAGMTWTQQLFVEHVSFLRIHMLDANEGWAIGGKIPSPFLLSGEFYHTTDGGKTWDNESHRDVFPMNFNFVGMYRGESINQSVLVWCPTHTLR
jgi:photosystem II stability/assembly factor-like uncharacterized protein